MLVLERNAGESVVIRTMDGTEVRIQVVRIVGRKVRLGFDAPLHVKIVRKEIDGREDAK